MKHVLALALVACHGARPPAPLPAASTATFALVATDQLVEDGDLTYVLGSDKITIARGDRVATVVPAPGARWTSAASIAAPDGDGRWIVGTRADGTLWRIRRDGDLEPIADRFGLGHERVLSVAASGSTTAIGLETGTAVTTDGVHLARYPAAMKDAFRGRLAVARDRVAIATGHAVEVWDLEHEASQTYALPDAFVTFVDARSPASRLVVSSGKRLWIERPSGGTSVARSGALDPIRAGHGSVVASGSRLWAIIRDTSHLTLAVLSGDAFVPTTAKTFDGELFASPTGDVWVGLTVRPSQQPARGMSLQRFSLDRPADPRWQADVAPVFQRVCAHCHLPGGDADFDLSTAAAWQQAKQQIRQRVLVDRTMPPAGTELSEPDRAALARWLSR